MAINKVHEEFHTLDMSKGWETPAGYPPGIQQKILSGALNETEKRGSGPACCASRQASTRQRRSFTNIGKKCSCSPAT